MPLELRPVASAQEVPEVVACYLEAFASPDSPFTHIAAPILGTSPTAHQDRIMNFSVRQWFSHCADRSSHWFKVVDTDRNDRVVASAKWNIYAEDPFKNERLEPTAYWWPEGPSRRYADAVLENLTKLRVRRQPHMLVFYTFTHPDYRRRGAGHLMMEWGTKKADELGLEIFIEASPLGSQLYTKHGFRVLEIAEIVPAPALDEDNEEWKRWRDLTTGLRCAILKRPVNGRWDGEEELIRAAGNLETNFWERSI